MPSIGTAPRKSLGSERDAIAELPVSVFLPRERDIGFAVLLDLE
jgi:hypothetical protein